MSPSLASSSPRLVLAPPLHHGSPPLLQSPHTFIHQAPLPRPLSTLNQPEEWILTPHPTADLHRSSARPLPPPPDPSLSFRATIPLSRITSCTALPHRLHLYRVTTHPPSENVYHAVSPLPPDIVRAVGLPPPSVLCLSRRPCPADAPPRALAPAAFNANQAYGRFLRAVVAKHAPQCRSSGPDALGSGGGGEVFVIDGRCTSPGGHVDAKDILGAFSIGRGKVKSVASGRVTAGGLLKKFSPNEGHAVLTRDGPTRVDDWMHERLLEELRALVLAGRQAHHMVEAVPEPGGEPSNAGSGGADDMLEKDCWVREEDEERKLTDLEFAYTAHPVWGERIERPFKGGSHRMYRVKTKFMRACDAVRGSVAVSLAGGSDSASGCVPRVGGIDEKRSRTKVKHI